VLILRLLHGLDFQAMQKAQDQHDALTALRLAQHALFGALSPGDSPPD
jgi:hypothetical protein